MDKRRSRRKQAGNIFPVLRSLNLQEWNKSLGVIDSSMQDLNLSGICVNCEKILPVGTYLSIDLMLRRRGNNVKVFGKVIWVKPEEGKYRTGIKFSWWKELDDKRLIDNFWEKLSFADQFTY
ncbi:MAG: PilZ domain-containing protein [Candidatus Omnitrophica bacterium]|nr:PilZ domain-containing protein [Candidatus Omnitrophota bacterium]